MKAVRIILLLAAANLTFSSTSWGKSDWDEGPPKSDQSKTRINRPSSENIPLQGVVEENSVIPSAPDKANNYQSGEAEKDKSNALSGKAIDDELRGMVRDGSLKPMPGLNDKTSPLQGQASLNDGRLQGMDPDADDRELMVEWDRWRNRFLRAVQLGVQELVNNPDPDDYERPRVDPATGQIMSRYPLGTGCAFSCQITRDGQIKNLEILESSGFPKYDKAVWRSVKQLEGTKILAFPKSSKRSTVTQAGRIKTATNSDFNYYHFGDVERVRSGQ